MDDPIKNFTKVYSTVLKEERHANITRVKEERNEAAMVVRGYGAGRHKGSSAWQESEEENLSPHCDYCSKDNHVKNECYEKYGYEVIKARGRGRGRGGMSNRRGNYGRGGGRSGGRGKHQENATGNATNGASSDADGQHQNIPFTDEEIERIRIILAGSEGSEKLTGQGFEDGDWAR
ncbi:hypothetical protein RND81_05G082200 [Saponaria officinalis]|uniref:Uncharacterized protein n=1 Tax=Saponaria officinalis TaxID=3572 RepID=A0AAW1KVM7_SAPOF